MPKHTITLDLTDREEQAWNAVLALTNAARPADQQLADVDGLIDLRLAELTQGAMAFVKQQVTEQVAPFLDALIEKVIADPSTKDRVTQTEALDVKVVAVPVITP